MGNISNRLQYNHVGVLYNEDKKVNVYIGPIPTLKKMDKLVKLLDFEYFFNFTPIKYDIQNKTVFSYKIYDIPLIQLEEQIDSFISDLNKIKDSCNILINCRHGRSRSVSMLSLLVLLTSDETPATLKVNIKKYRKCAKPNFGFKTEIENIFNNNKLDKSLIQFTNFKFSDYYYSVHNNKNLPYNITMFSNVDDVYLYHTDIQILEDYQFLKTQLHNLKFKTSILCEDTDSKDSIIYGDKKVVDNFKEFKGKKIYMLLYKL